MIEIACQTYSLRSRSGPDMLESVRKAGFRAVELWVGHADYRADPGSAARMRRAAERTGVALQSYCVGGFVREGVATVADRLARAFAYAAELGVSLVTGVVDRRAIPVVDALCRRTGLRFAVENHWYADIARGDDWRRALVDASPLVGATLDTGHAVAAGEDPCAVLAALGERVLDVHLKDVVVSTRLQRLLWRRPRMEGRSIGGGDVPIAPLLAALVAADYAGCVALEDERPDLPLSELQASLRACTGFLRAAVRQSADGVALESGR
ncbi:MAG TPA: sugar phosphate isomerase/epimerase [Candidatus Binatia bacterium]|nr:sugar phosphate isomerase/epimerase [Candidatus Binatia bacterium]